MEWLDAQKYNSFNSWKGLAYYKQYQQINDWLNGDSSYLPPPIECNLDPVAECNNRCYFCITQRYLTTHRSEVGEMRKLSLDYMHRLIDFLAKWGVKGLCISGGGEPTLIKETHGLPSYAVERGMKVSLFTNATNVTDELADNIMLCQWVSLSVNAGDRETYRRITKRDYFDKVIENITSLALLKHEIGSKVALTYNFLLLPENVMTMHKTCKLAKAIGMTNFHVRPIDFERSDIEGHKALSLDRKRVEEQFALCHQEETETFQVYTVTHKFNGDYHVKHDFTRCLATPLVLPILTDGNAYLCVDRKMESDFKLGSCYPEPENILSWWGSERHKQLIKSVDIQKCSRCTWSQYNQQIENTVCDDKMCLSFP